MTKRCLKQACQGELINRFSPKEGGQHFKQGVVKCSEICIEVARREHLLVILQQEASHWNTPGDPLIQMKSASQRIQETELQGINLSLETKAVFEI